MKREDQQPFLVLVLLMAILYTVTFLRKHNPPNLAGRDSSSYLKKMNRQIDA